MPTKVVPPRPAVLDEVEAHLAAQLERFLSAKGPRLADEVCRLYEAAQAEKLAKAKPPVVAVDFDDTLSGPRSSDDATIFDSSPIPGAFEFLSSLRDAGMQIVIFSARFARGSDEDKAAVASGMIGWFKQHGLASDVIAELRFGAVKNPEISVFFDNRAMHFDGEHYPTVDEIEAFIEGELP